MHLLAALALFDQQLAADGRSDHTRAQYRRHVALFARWLDGEGRGSDLTSIEPPTIARFLVSPLATTNAHGGRKKATSMNGLRTSLRVFFGWCADADLIAKSPARLVRLARCGTMTPRVPSEDELARLNAILDSARGPANERDRVLVRLLLATGIRLGSALALDIEDVDLDRGEVVLRTTKGDRPQVVYLTAAIRGELRVFLGARALGPLFVGAAGRRLGARHVQRRVASWLRAAGIRSGGSVHVLRHSFATRLYQRTRDVLLVQRALGHRSVASTLVYARADEHRIRQAMQSA